MTRTECWQQQGWQEQSDDNKKDDSSDMWLGFLIASAGDNEDRFQCDDNDKHDDNKEDKNRVMTTTRMTAVMGGCRGFTGLWPLWGQGGGWALDSRVEYLHQEGPSNFRRRGESYWRE